MLKSLQSPKDTMHFILQVGKQEKIVFFNEKEIRVVFTLHHVEYFIQETPVFYRILSFAELVALPETEDGILTFFLLLPITKLEADKQSRTEVDNPIHSIPVHHLYMGMRLLENSAKSTHFVMISVLLQIHSPATIDFYTPPAAQSTPLVTEGQAHFLPYMHHRPVWSILQSIAALSRPTLTTPLFLNPTFSL